MIDEICMMEREPRTMDRKRFRELLKKIRACRCRECQKVYQDDTSRAFFMGYCSQKCLKAKAKRYGWSEKKGGRRLFDTISKEVGSVYVHA